MGLHGKAVLEDLFAVDPKDTISLLDPGFPGFSFTWRACGALPPYTKVVEFAVSLVPAMLIHVGLSTTLNATDRSIAAKMPAQAGAVERPFGASLLGFVEGGAGVANEGTIGSWHRESSFLVSRAAGVRSTGGHIYVHRERRGFLSVTYPQVG